MNALIILVVLGVAASPHNNLVNVALNKPARIKDVYTRGYGGAAERGNDGVSITEYELYSCAHSETAVDTWWMVDLLGDYEITAVNLTNRNAKGNRLSNFSVFVSWDNPMNVSQFPKKIPGQLCFYRQNQIPEGGYEVVPCAQRTTGRYLILHKAQGYLTICELEAFATKLVSMNYRLYAGEKLIKQPFHTMDGITNSKMCIRLCRQAPGGSATGVQYHPTDGRCECIQISRFQSYHIETNSSTDWNLYLAQNN